MRHEHTHEAIIAGVVLRGGVLTHETGHLGGVAVREDLDVEVEPSQTTAQVLHVHLGALALTRPHKVPIVDYDCKAHPALVGRHRTPAPNLVHLFLY